MAKTFDGVLAVLLLCAPRPRGRCERTATGSQIGFLASRVKNPPFAVRIASTWFIASDAPVGELLSVQMKDPTATVKVVQRLRLVSIQRKDPAVLAIVVQDDETSLHREIHGCITDISTEDASTGELQLTPISYPLSRYK